MAAPDVGMCISAGIDGIRKNFVTHVVAFLLVGIIAHISFGLLAGPMLVGYMRLVRIDAEGGKAEIGDVFKGFDDFIPALLAVLVSGIIVGVGFMLCIVPGLLIMALVPTAAYLVAMGEKDGINAIRRAWRALQDHLLGAFLCALLLLIVGSLGAIACGIGLLVTMPVAFIGSYHMARQLTDGGAPAAA